MTQYSKATLLKMLIAEKQARFNRSLFNNKSAMASCSKYGITTEKLVETLVAQDFNCGICGATFEDRRWDIDHCHITGKFRGLLCHWCNTWLGKNEGIAQAAVRYLEKANV